MRRTALAAFVLLLAVSLSLHASDGILVPQEVYVGDTAELSFESAAFLNVLEDGILYTVPQEDFPVSADLDIKSILVVQTGDTASVTVRFVPWIAGAIKVPSFTLKKISVTPPVVRIASLVEKTGRTALEPARPPLLVPGTTWRLYGLLAAAFGMLALCVFAGIRLRRFFLEFPGKRQAGRRVKILLRELKALERKSGKMDVLSWYAKFALSLRRYLGAFCEGDFLAFLPLTGTEIASRAKEKLETLSVAESPGLPARVASLFSDSDTIRFSGAASAGGGARTDFASREMAGLAAARDLVAAFEAAMAAGAKEEDSHARIQ